jgi:hypothetical protein
MSDTKRQELGRRIKGALAARQAEGLNVGRPRLIDPAVEDLILRRHSQGVSIRRIAAELQAAGVPTPGAKVWRHSTVLRVIDRHPELGRGPRALRSGIQCEGVGTGSRAVPGRTDRSDQVRSGLERRAGVWREADEPSNCESRTYEPGGRRVRRPPDPVAARRCRQAAGDVDRDGAAAPQQQPLLEDRRLPERRPEGSLEPAEYRAETPRPAAGSRPRGDRSRPLGSGRPGWSEPAMRRDVKRRAPPPTGAQRLAGKRRCSNGPGRQPALIRGP